MTAFTNTFTYYMAAFIDGMLLVALLDALGVVGGLWLLLFVVGCFIPGPCEIMYRVYVYTLMTRCAAAYVQRGKVYK